MSRDSYNRSNYVVPVKGLKAHISQSKKNKLHSINRTHFHLMFVCACKVPGLNISNVALILDLLKKRS